MHISPYECSSLFVYTFVFVVFRFFTFSLHFVRIVRLESTIRSSYWGFEVMESTMYMA